MKFKKFTSLVITAIIIFVLAGCQLDENDTLSSNSSSNAEMASAISMDSEVYNVAIHINFTSNLVFSKYDVSISIDGVEYGTMEHGVDADYEFDLKSGEHQLAFISKKSSSITGSSSFVVEKDMKLSYKISCYNDKITIEEEIISSNNSSSETNSVNSISSLPESSTTSIPNESVASDPVQNSSTSSSDSVNSSSAPVSSTPVDVNPVVSKPVSTSSTHDEDIPYAPAETQTTGIELVSMTNPLRRNEDAQITIKGKPNTEYRINVYYSSGRSTAAGLENKISDSNGYVTWTWHVGGRTNLGDNKRVEIVGGGQTLKTTFSVVN